MNGPGSEGIERAAAQTAGAAQLRRPLRNLLATEVTRQIRSCELCCQHGRIPVHNKSRRQAGQAFELNLQYLQYYQTTI